MRTRALGLLAVLVLAAQAAVGAQFLFPETLEPRVDAAHAEWQITGEPLVFEGITYFRAGATRFFDSNVMVRSGVYRGIPLYQDRTIEPYSIMYVPIGGRLMRPYERRRDGELAGTTGSRTPSFPVSTRSEPEEWYLPESTIGTSGAIDGTPFTNDGNTYVGTAGVVVINPPPTPVAPAPAAAARAPQSRPRLETIPGPSGPNGMYIEYSGSRWYGSGTPTSYVPQTFTPIGSYAGFIVYRMNGDTRDRVWVPVVEGGLLAQYSRR